MLLIKNGHVIDPKTQFDQVADLLIDGEKIIKIAPDLQAEKGMVVLDATGKIIAPGLIDIHVHFREPDQTHKETIHTGALAAAVGGFTSVVMMANTSPVLSSPELVSDVLELSKMEVIHIHTVASITSQFDGENVTDFKALAEAGAVGFSDDGVPLKSSKIVAEALKKASAGDWLISLHEEDPDLVGTLGLNESDLLKAKCGISGASNLSEYSMIARDAMLALGTNGRLHFQHLSAGQSVDVVRFAKQIGARVSTEVTPQHFSLTEEAVISVGSNAKVNPPLRKSSDIDQIIAGLKDGTIDVIATDHAPHTKEEKAQALAKSPSGMIGLETSLQLGLTHLVAKKHLTLSQLLEKMTCNPAELYGFDAGYLKENGPADIVIFDAELEQEITDHFQSMGSNSPFIRQKVKGQVQTTICRGKVIYQK